MDETVVEQFLAALMRDKTEGQWHPDVERVKNDLIWSNHVRPQARPGDAGARKGLRAKCEARLLWTPRSGRPGLAS